MPRIHLNKLKMIVRQEVFRKRMLREGEDRKVALDHADSAAKCLDAIEKYKEASSAKAMGEMEGALETVEKVLNRIVASPLEYGDVMTSDYEAEPAGSSGDEDVELDLDVEDEPQISRKKSVKPNLM